MTSPKYLFKLPARVGNPRFGMGCKARNAANGLGHWQVLLAPQTAPIRLTARRARISDRFRGS